MGSSRIGIREHNADLSYWTVEDAFSMRRMMARSRCSTLRLQVVARYFYRGISDQRRQVDSLALTEKPFRRVWRWDSRW